MKFKYTKYSTSVFCNPIVIIARNTVSKVPIIACLLKLTTCIIPALDTILIKKKNVSGTPHINANIL